MNLNFIVPILLILIVVLFVINKRQKASGRPQSGKSDKKNSSSKSKNKKAKIVPEEAEHLSTINKSKEKKAESYSDWDWQGNKNDETTVSVATVDHLTEYKVYKQFGYFLKAAESLAIYMKQNASKQSEDMISTLAAELGELCLQAKNPDKLSEFVDQYHDHLNQEILEKLIRQGLAIDENHLGLRVLAENLLHWDINETDKKLRVDNNQKFNPQIVDEFAIDDQDETGIALEPLVEGHFGNFRVRGDEREVLLSFSKPEKSYALLKEQLPYDAAIRCLNKAIKISKKPAGLIIDALALDYRHNSINVFAQHLWSLYYTLGHYGNKVKERMLGWGYSLGQHPMFEQLESKPGETILRDIGITQGYLPANSSALKAKRLPLVENSNSDDVGETPAERVQHDVKSLLNFGQFDEAMDLLEKSILLYPQESQLYITLFDLYERAEEWMRLEKMLQIIRSQIQTPPEEVILAMSQLLKRINHRGVQNQ